MTDERKNLPSASGAERIFLCPGSWAIEQQAKAELPPEAETPEATTGHRIHAAYAGDKVLELELEDEDLKVLDIARATEKALVATYFEGEKPTSELREQRLWLRDADGAEIISAQFDALFMRERSGLILDLKTGWDDELPDGDRNIQLRTEAMIVRRNFELTEIGVSLIEPRQGKPRLAVYDEADLARSEIELLAALDASRQPNAPRRPGVRQCKYCKAQAICPEARELTTRLAAPVRAELLTPSERGDRVELLKLGIKLAEAELALYKTLLDADPAAVTGYHLADGGSTKPITDALRCYQQASVYLDPAKFVECCTVGKKKLKEALKTATSERGKALDTIVDVVTAGCVTEKEKAPSLERITA